ncbi:gamma-glutamyltransferase family protein [Rhizobium sp.]|uniref:gamma-glutamyltransferase family protein n=1 Tax=Rhizobium sp. TaxID=391 RepID=UPI002AA86C76
MTQQFENGPPKNAAGRNGMMIAPHWQASEAGLAVLARGGNAIEAVIAAGAALSVLYPHFCGLGGDAVWMVSDADGKVSSLLGIGQAPQNIDGIESIAVRGPGSMLTTACLVDSWGVLLDHSKDLWGGVESFANLLAPAIQLAEESFAVSPSQQFWFDLRAGERGSWPGFANLFVREGLQRQPQLAETLRSLAQNGPRDFYEGALARKIAKGLGDLGAPLTLDDLAATRARFAKPVSLTYRDLTLLAPPPPTQGLTTLGIMGVLGHHSMADEPYGSAGFYHHLVEAVKQAFLDRQVIADPDFSGLAEAALLLDPAHLRAKAQTINADQAFDWPHIYKQGDTSFLAAVDAQGRAACVLQSIYFDWGSGAVVGDTGILWQNRGAAFNLDPKSPNCLQASKRPFYTLNPGIALKNGRPHLVYGTQGADGQPQTLALLLSLLIDHGLSPEAALAQPRFLLGKTFSDSRDSLKLEDNLSETVLANLQARGHQLSRLPAFSPLGGQAGIIKIEDDGRILAAHDPRSDGAALAL